MRKKGTLVTTVANVCLQQWAAVCVMDGGWNSIGAFIVNKLHVFIISLCLPGLDRGGKVIIPWQRALPFPLTCIMKQKKLRAQGSETSSCPPFQTSAPFPDQ